MNNINRESVDHPGYFHPSGVEEVCVSRNGNIVNCKTGNTLNAIVRNHGYLSVNVEGMKVTGEKVCKQYLVHRLLGLAFIPIPDKYKNVPIRKVQINHIDGDKLNNNLVNLEWCLAKKNMRHAFKNKLIDIGKVILAKHLITGEIKKYNSIRECAESHELERKSLQRHLVSKYVGRKTKDWFVFKSDDGSDWPQIDWRKTVENSWNITKVVIIANVAEKVKYITDTIKQACEILNFDYKSVKNFRSFNGVDKPFNGWLFEEFDLVEVDDISKIVTTRTKFGREDSREFLVTNTDTGVTMSIVGTKALSIFLDYSRIHVTMLAKSKEFKLNNYLVKEIQGQTGLTLGKV